jgi:hypothetical protein
LLCDFREFDVSSAAKRAASLWANGP